MADRRELELKLKALSAIENERLMHAGNNRAKGGGAVSCDIILYIRIKLEKYAVERTTTMP